MTFNRTPPYRAEHIGSFIRPDNLLNAARAFKKGEIDNESFNAIKNKSITDISPYNQCLTDWEAAKEQFIKDTTVPDIDWEMAFKGNRTNLLTQSDWTQVADNKLTDEKKAEWVVYRQALRDMPANKTTTYEELAKDRYFAHSDWPTPPS